MLRRILLIWVGSTLAASTLCAACSDDDETGASVAPAPTEEARHGLTAAQASEVLVEVAGETITVGDFADRLAEQSPYLRARYNSPERRREFLDNLVRFKLLAAEAHRRGYDQDEEVVQTRKQVMIQQMMKDEFENAVQLSDITDGEVRAYYEEHRTEFQKPEQVRASHILIKNRREAQRVLDQVLEHADDVNFFRRTAERRNEDPETRDRFGDLRFFSRPSDRIDGDAQIPDPVAQAAFEIEQIGRVYPSLVHTEQGYHIVKLTGRRAALNRTLEEARRPIQNRLWRERREQRIQQFIDGLRRDAHVEEDLDALATVHVAPAGGNTPSSREPTGMPGPAPDGAHHRPPRDATRDGMRSP